MNNLIIDPEFHRLIAPLTVNEKNLLCESILNEGCREPICIWNNIIIDGHNRYEICTANNIAFTTKTYLFDSRNDVIVWICANQLGRRNITEETRKYLIGKRYEAEKNIGIRNQSGRNQYTTDYNTDEQLITAAVTSTTVHKLGNEYFISHNTVLKYGSYANALDKLSEISPMLTPRILSGNIKVSHENVMKLSSLPEDEILKLSNQLSEQNNVFIRYSDSRSKLSDKPITPVPMSVMPLISVKNMPKYDPDAEISSLRLTIPSWISFIQRVQSAAIKNDISDQARDQLITALNNLINSIHEILAYLMQENNK